MAQDFTALFDAKYNPAFGFAKSATFTPSGGGPVSLYVVETTEDAEISPVGDLYTVRPAADVRTSTFLASGLTRDDIRDGTLTVNGKTWRVSDYRHLNQKVVGEDAGDMRFLLSET